MGLKVAKTLNLTVLSPDRVILDVENVTKVRAKLRDDTRLSIYPGHAPLLAELLPGTLEYAIDSEESELELSAGILQVTQQHITVFVSKTHEAGEVRDGPEASDIEQFEKLSQMLMQSLDAHYKAEAPQ